MSHSPLPDVLMLVKAFVEGGVNVEVFADHLYTNEDLEQLLRSAAPIPPFSTSNVHNLFQYLIELNFKSEHDVRNARDALSRLLTNEGIPHVKSEMLATRATLLMQAQPKWLDLNPEEFRYFLEDAGSRQGQVLRDWMKAELLQQFKYTKRPPRWLQAPRWPIREGRPLVFLGQVGADGFFHDAAQVYVFLNPTTGEVETILQLA